MTGLREQALAETLALATEALAASTPLAHGGTAAVACASAPPPSEPPPTGQVALLGTHDDVADILSQLGYANAQCATDVACQAADTLHPATLYLHFTFRWNKWK